jgi:transcriptional regulator with XRE-family HTH domain
VKGAHTLEELRAELCKDEKFREAYRRQRPYSSILVAIIKKRTELGLTQKQLAKRANTTQSCISRIESGRHNVRLGTLVNIAEALGVSVDIHFPDQAGEGDYADLFKTEAVSAVQEAVNYAEGSIDHKVAETKWNR